MRTSLALMVPMLGFLAIFQTTVGPRLELMGVRPDLILLLVVAWTLFHGSGTGIVWGFIGGIWMDVLSGGPMGSSSLSLIAASLVAGIGFNRFFRTNPVVPVVATIMGTLAYAFTYIAILALIRQQLLFGETFLQLILPSVLYNSVLMLVLTPWLKRWLGRRELETLA